MSEKNWTPRIVEGDNEPEPPAGVKIIVESKMRPDGTVLWDARVVEGQDEVSLNKNPFNDAVYGGPEYWDRDPSARQVIATGEWLGHLVSLYVSKPSTVAKALFPKGPNSA